MCFPLPINFIFSFCKKALPINYSNFEFKNKLTLLFKIFTIYKNKYQLLNFRVYGFDNYRNRQDCAHI